MILIDWSQTVIAGALAFGSDFDKGKDTKKMVDIVRHSVLTTFLSHKRKFGKKFGDIVVAVDGRDYWRRSIFPQYKSHRAKARSESKTDWKSVFDIATQIRQELAEVFPYKIVFTDKAEADDIIAVMCEWLQENELNNSLLAEDPQDILIFSNDGDFKQLHKFKGVRQWNPILKKYVEKPDKYFLIEKIIQGDTGDGIPNIRSTDNQLVEGIRQPPITAKLKEEARRQFDAGREIKFADEFMMRNFQRNQKLISFEHIPAEIRESIIEAYINNTVVRDKGKIFNYFIKHRCKLLMEKIQEF